MARYGPLWQFPARKTAAGTDCGTQPARGAGTAGVGQSVGLWLGILPRGRRGPLFPDFSRQTGIPPQFRDMPAEGLPGVPAPTERQGFPLPLVNLPPPADQNTRSQYAAGQVSGVSGSLGAGPGRTVFHRCGDPGPVLPL